MYAISFALLSSWQEILRADQFIRVDPMRIAKLDAGASKTDSLKVAASD
jgi:hypothetical protein